MEFQILECINYDLSCVTPIDYLLFLTNWFKLDKKNSKLVEYIVKIRFILELSLLDEQVLRFSCLE